MSMLRAAGIYRRCRTLPWITLISVCLSAPAFAEDTAASETKNQEVEALEPAVSSELLASRVKRREDGDRVIDELDLDSTRITGNRELPKVLYIVPWKQSDLGELVGRPVNSLLDEALEPVDREVFQRQISYYDNLYGPDEIMLEQ